MTSSVAASPRGGEPAQIAEQCDDFGAAPFQHDVVALAVDELSDLRGKKPFQFGDAFLPFLRHCEIGRHGVELSASR